MLIDSPEMAGGSNIAPAGVIQAFAGTTAPDGWLECDGSAVSRSTYARLYANIGDSWGEGDGSTTFNLPDLIGRFLRGRDTAGTRDPDYEDRTACNTGGNEDGEVGSVQAEGTKTAAVKIQVSSSGVAAPYYDVFVATGDVTVTSSGDAQLDISAVQYDKKPNTSSAGVRRDLKTTASGTETRPINASVMYIIKT